MKRIKADRAVSCLSQTGTIRAAAIINTNTARTAQEKHNLSPLPAYLLARQLASASMLAIFLKGEERIVLEAEGDGIIKKVYSEAIQVGEVRGYVLHDDDLELGKLSDLSEALGNGLYKVKRMLYDKPEPIVGVVELFKGNIAEDLAYYFTQSEQVPTAVILDTGLDAEEKIAYSAGLIIQAMPGATQKELENIEDYLSKLDFREIAAQAENAEDLLKNCLPFEFSILKNDRIDFFCRCSKEKFMDKLITLKLSEVQEMKAANENELICHYCNSHYYLEEKDFDSMIARMTAKMN